MPFLARQLKYSNIHGQLRALTILKTIVENGGSRFQSALLPYALALPELELTLHVRP